MVRSLFAALFGGACRNARATSTPAPRFVPTVQSLEAREVPAVFGLFAAVEPASAAPVEDANTAAVARTATSADGYLTIKLEDILVSNYSAQASSEGGADTTGDTTAKVKLQDFHFTTKVSKASPGVS